MTKYNKGVKFFLCVTDICSKYVWVVPMKDKKIITVTNALQKILEESWHKPNNMWIDYYLLLIVYLKLAMYI